MSEEALPIYSGRLLKKGVIIDDPNAIQELKNRGYGEEEGGKLRLEDYEVLYLLYINKLKVSKGGKDISFDEFVDYSLKKDPNAWTRFLIYRDLRSRGYVAKGGFGFGVDFRVYERGTYGSKPAKYLVSGLNEGREMSLKDLSQMVTQVSRMGKDMILAVIERRGEVIYYQVSGMRFERR
ncbi:MAG: tRNA-intron lyase [Nitrososphaerota archaeon]|nr:tRNA-intron lyase [Nitrososphaerales archaeon]MDW8045355.1 tRNA-intron lyase [Nitrososphaerota archaeon]